ncbi:MAG: hemolysin family protein [Pirellula sp.]
MQHPDWIVLSLFGLVMAAIAGFGNHLLRNFRGRTLEAYCRLRGKRERFGQILDEVANCKIACNYMFIFSGSVALVAGGMWLFALHQSGLTATGVHSISAIQLVSYCVLAGVSLTCLYSWIPKIVVRNSASMLLYHTWWCWHSINATFYPFRVLEGLFTSIGHRLSDRRIGDRIEEESLEDEIRTMVMMGERKGLVTRSMREMISGVMNLDEGQVSQIMTPRSKIDAVDVDWSWDKMQAAVTQSGRTRMPAYEGSLDNIVGILFVKDLMAFLQQQNRPDDAIEIKQILRESWMIPATRQVDELLKDFLVRRSHMAIVVDEFQQTLGVVTIEDALEEIVGEIADELDVDETLPLYVEDPDGGYSLAGVLEVSAANRLLSLDLPESDDYDTVAGLAIATIGTLPKVGAKTKVGKYQLTVTQATARSVQRVRIVWSPVQSPSLTK